MDIFGIHDIRKPYAQQANRDLSKPWQLVISSWFISYKNCYWFQYLTAMFPTGVLGASAIKIVEVE